MRLFGSNKKRFRLTIKSLLLLIGTLTGIGFTLLTLRLVDPSSTEGVVFPLKSHNKISEKSLISISVNNPDLSFNSSSQISDGFEKTNSGGGKTASSCATVEQMGEIVGDETTVWKESLRVRKLILDHFDLYGPSRVRRLPPDQFCHHGFVIAKASEAGFGNEMYKILTAAALSIMLNRSLIIGQTRGKYPFGDYITYTDVAFTLKEVKHLWRQNRCMSKYSRDLVVRIDDFKKPSHTNILCSNWKEWEEPIIWIQNTTDAVGAQFFLKNVHPEMRSAAVELFGKTELLSRPNVFGELMKVLISPSASIEAAVKSVLAAGEDPDISLHMRMLMNSLCIVALV